MNNLMTSLKAKKQSKKGFTLMEMLIVVAIAIPTFTSQLNKAREATDQANIRSAYAVAQTTILTNEDPVTGAKMAASATVTYNFQKDGSFAATGINDYLCQSAGAEVDTVTGVVSAKEKPIILTIKSDASQTIISADISIGK